MSFLFKSVIVNIRMYMVILSFTADFKISNPDNVEKIIIEEKMLIFGKYGERVKMDIKSI